MVNRSNKRSQPDVGPDLLDPTEFVDRFCRENKLVEENQVGLSKIEKQCIRSAELARQLYKDHRDDELERRGEPVPRTDLTQTPGTATASQAPITLSPAQKYSRRLFNNRKSAAAAKVYQDVMKRSLATIVQRIPETPDPQAGEALLDYPTLLEENRQLKQQVQSCRSEVSRLQQSLTLEKRNVECLEHRNRQLRAAAIGRKTALETLAGWDKVEKNSRKEILKILEDPQQQPPMTSQDLEIVHQMPSQSQLANSQSLFMSEAGSQQASQPLAGSTGTIPANALRYSSSMALSPVANEGDAKDFQTGLTCSQSQRCEDGEDTLARSSHPLPMNIVVGNSQSQELPSLKTPIGSEDNPLGEDGFFLNSQGSKGN